ncbi:MAG: NAD(P)-dependent oxidoreductase [Methyloceanibacter sp.]
MQVGFIGLGHMGSGMAANLLAAGHALTIYNRSPARTEPLVGKGAKLAKTPGDAARGQVVITMLADDAALEHVVFGKSGVLEALAPGAIHVSMSTISVALAERLATAHGEKGQEFVAAPVFGRPDAAAAAKLFIVAAGKLAAIATCQPLFDVLGQRTFVVSDEAPKANLVKLRQFPDRLGDRGVGRGHRAGQQSGDRQGAVCGCPHQHAVRCAGI